jgi:hypothetical protein
MVRKKHPDQIESPAIDIRADVKAKAVRFEEGPETSVDFHGDVEDRTREKRMPESQPEVEGGSASERENIPDEVEPGVTYRDVRVRWRAAAGIEDPDD